MWTRRSRIFGKRRGGWFCSSDVVDFISSANSTIIFSSCAYYRRHLCIKKPNSHFQLLYMAIQEWDIPLEILSLGPSGRLQISLHILKHFSPFSENCPRFMQEVACPECHQNLAVLDQGCRILREHHCSVTLESALCLLQELLSLLLGIHLLLFVFFFSLPFRS